MIIKRDNNKYEREIIDCGKPKMPRSMMPQRRQNSSHKMISKFLN